MLGGISKLGLNLFGIWDLWIFKKKIKTDNYKLGHFLRTIKFQFIMIKLKIVKNN